jgi:hypothetical protein
MAAYGRLFDSRAVEYSQMGSEPEIPTLGYATADQQIRRPLLGRIATGFALVAGIIGIASFQFELDLGGLISFGLGAIGLVLSLVAVVRGISRTGIAWLALCLSIIYWIGAFLVETWLGNIG